MKRAIVLTIAVLAIALGACAPLPGPSGVDIVEGVASAVTSEPAQGQVLTDADATYIRLVEGEGYGIAPADVIPATKNAREGAAQVALTTTTCTELKAFARQLDQTQLASFMASIAAYRPSSDLANLMQTCDW